MNWDTHLDGVRLVKVPGLGYVRRAKLRRRESQVGCALRTVNATQITGKITNNTCQDIEERTRQEEPISSLW